MKKQNRILAFVCALAMIMTMFSSVVVFAADAPVLKATVVEAEMPTKAGETVTVEVAYSGFSTVSISQAQFVLPFDAELFEFDAAASKVATKNGSLSLAKDGLSVKYAYLDMTGESPITTDDVLATVVFKLKADVTEDKDVKFELTKTSMTNDGATIKPDDGSLKVEDVETKVEAPYEGVKFVATAEGTPVVAGDELSVSIKIENLGSVSISQAQFVLPFDAEVFEFDAAASKAATANGSLSLAKDGLSVKYAFLDMTGENPLSTADLATVVFKLKADVTADKTVTFEPTNISMTNENLTYKPGTENNLKAYAAKVTLTTEPPVASDVKISLDKTTATAAAGKKVQIKATVTGATNKDVTAKATAGDVTVDGNVVTVTVPATAKTGDTITVTVAAAADAKVTAKCVITVENPAYVVAAVKETVTMNSGSVTMFKPTITVDNAAEFEAKFEDDTKYRVIFDFATAKGANAGYAMMVVTGAKIKAIAAGEDAGVYANVTAAASAELHIEDMAGNIK